ncbi:phosphatidylethanolamine N-methyltransferase isoform X4 [Ranitomeya variabilis]|uniref:phosphatidylethanolamine N-methyltransferase isoform X4 n=1 Tax=Ranitomeya variabilis TaxID=490064 RepID=UPI004056CD00
MIAVEGSIDLSIMAGLSRYVDLMDYNFLLAVACIIFNPLFWNVVARWEYHTHALSRIFGSPYAACYILGALIIFLAIFRSHCFTEAISSQPHSWFLKRPEFYYLGVALVACGFALVITSFLALGFVGTYLGTPAPLASSSPLWSPCATKSPSYLKARLLKRFTGTKRRPRNTANGV